MTTAAVAIPSRDGISEPGLNALLFLTTHVDTDERRQSTADQSDARQDERGGRAARLRVERRGTTSRRRHRQPLRRDARRTQRHVRVGIRRANVGGEIGGGDPESIGGIVGGCGGTGGVAGGSGKPTIGRGPSVHWVPSQ